MESQPPDRQGILLNKLCFAAGKMVWYICFFDMFIKGLLCAVGQDFSALALPIFKAGSFSDLGHPEHCGVWSSIPGPQGDNKHRCLSLRHHLVSLGAKTAPS